MNLDKIPFLSNLSYFFCFLIYTFSIFLILAFFHLINIVYIFIKPKMSTLLTIIFTKY